MKTSSFRRWLPLLASIALLWLLHVPHFAIHAFYGYVVQALIALLMAAAVYRRSGLVVLATMCVVIPILGWQAEWFDKAQIPFRMLAAGALMGALAAWRGSWGWMAPLLAAVAHALFCALGVFLLLVWRKEMTPLTALLSALARQARPLLCTTLGALAGWALHEPRLRRQ